MDAKQPGNLIFAVGLTKNELGGSHYYKVNGELGANVPTTDLKVAAETAKRLHQAIKQGLVRSCHDCSEGGLAVALAEMAFAGNCGIEADLGGVPASEDCVKIEAMLFSESNSRYLVEIEPQHFDAFAKLILNIPFGQVGEVIRDKKLIIHDKNQNTLIDADLKSLKNAWQQPLKW
jgi:phosphoribosylformylglycinamidine synthase